jgi:acyl-coenzyme A synthetase/AMP-(fatty) acid ligase
MQGYFGRINETASAFIDNPLSPGRGEKIYCTGDWVTLDEDGNFLFIGRKDHMIKTRGYRVELGEIETCLYRHAEIREAVVVAIPDDLIGNKLRAFVSMREGAKAKEMDLKRHCLTGLPAYMVPEDVVILDELPKTGNDKIDRQQLRQQSTVTN